MLYDHKTCFYMLKEILIIIQIIAVWLETNFSSQVCKLIWIHESNLTNPGVPLITSFKWYTLSDYIMLS